MYRPVSGPLVTSSTGAAGPKPEMPSWTITPLATATSTAAGPQAPPSVRMSTPWSRVQSATGTAIEGLAYGKMIGLEGFACGTVVDGTVVEGTVAGAVAPGEV